MKNAVSGFACAAAALALQGCRTPGFEERAQDAAQFRASLAEETRAFFSTNTAPLTLAEAMGLARQRTLKLTQEQLDRHLAQIQRATAFSAFLPSVEATFSRQGSDVTIWRSIGSMTVKMNDQYANTAGITLTQPIFTPSAWLLFVESKYALRAQDLVRARAEELLDVQVASLFYQTAVSEKMVKTYELQRDATRTLAAQIDALAAQGYALSAEQARAKARLASDALQLREAADTLKLTRSRLFEILRFWPLEDVVVDGGSMTAVLGRDWVLADDRGEARRIPRDEIMAFTTEELLWQTLLNRKELWAGDQSIEISKTEVLRALAGFLPTLYGSASANYTSESMQIPSQYWGGGVSAVVSLFSGFRTVNDYRAAKARRKAEYQAQEDRALALIVATFEAHRNWRRSFEQREAADLALRAAELDYRVVQARYQEDQETLSDVLDKLAVLENARVQAVAAEYACALAEIVLRDAAGVGLGEVRGMEKAAAEAFRKESLWTGLWGDRK